MKNIFRNIVVWYKDSLISFTIFLAAIITLIVFLIFRNIPETTFTTFLYVFLWFILMIGTIYTVEKISRKYIVEIPDEIKYEYDSYILKTAKGEIFKMTEKCIWSPGGKIYKVKSKNPDKEEEWGLDQRENTFLLPITIGEIISTESNEELFIIFFVKEGFNPLEIYNIYQENNLEIIDSCLYIEEALKEAIINLNKRNEKLRKNGIHSNDNFVEEFRQSLLIPKFSGVKNYATYRKQES